MYVEDRLDEPLASRLSLRSFSRVRLPFGGNPDRRGDLHSRRNLHRTEARRPLKHTPKLTHIIHEEQWSDILKCHLYVCRDTILVVNGHTSRIGPPSAIWDYLRIFAIICDALRQSAIICDNLRLFAIICNYLQLFAIICDYLRFYETLGGVVSHRRIF